MNLVQIDEVAQSIIKQAGERIKASLHTQMTITEKSSPSDLVTNIDMETEQFFVSQVNQHFPTHRLLGEEGFGDTITDWDGYVWIVDPIDGTTNFINQQRNFCITVGIYKEGIGELGYIYQVMTGEMISATKGQGAFQNGKQLPKLATTQFEDSLIGVNASWVAPNRHIDHTKVAELVKRVRGTRSYGSAALEISYVVTGRLDAYFSMRLSAWDVAGGMVIAEEVGAICGTLGGGPFDLLKNQPFIIANPALFDEIITYYLTPQTT
ncbi:inositol monophosphatase family protein [Chryseomicrobium sp. FSL W7-1435]|uniref:inositol monophosphatase family protein n=1 Tax=Chryseomicrobium sp. FSL W7-1435 TaxID=2921704 RepID=UPI003159AF98